MRIKHQASDFIVEEQITLPGEQGAYAYYRVEKNGRSTTSVRDEMADKLKVTPSALVFPALKDKSAITVQFASVRKKGPATLSGKGYTATRVQWGPRALRPRDLEFNKFSIVMRDLTAEQAAALVPALQQIETYGMPNYFDEQRFGSLTADGFIGKEILKRDAERVVHMYLAESMLGDPEEIREFKELVTSHWGQWGFLLHQAPRPSNFRSVITYLKDHPHDYRPAANLIQDRLLSIYLSAYQSWVWNRILDAYLREKYPSPYTLPIAIENFAMPEPSADTLALTEKYMDLPRLTAVYSDDLSAVTQRIFELEDLEIRDFKARILRRVYLSKGERSMWCQPTEVTTDAIEDDDAYQGKHKLTTHFTLQPGLYATLVLKCATALIGGELKLR